MRGFIAVSTIGFALVMSWLITGQFGYQPEAHTADFTDARWITTTQPASSGYFRKRFDLPARPDKAYLIVQGTESIDVFVNDRQVGTTVLVEHQPTLIVDVRKNLQLGENLLAVRATTRSLGVSPVLRLRLVLQSHDMMRELVSDGTWRATGLPVTPLRSTAEWSTLAYSDIGWPAAVEGYSTLTQKGPAQPEQLYQLFPNGDWMRSMQVAKKEVTFRRAFTLPGSEVVDAWLGVSLVGHYAININGIPVRLDMRRALSSSTMETFNVGPLLRLGENELIISTAGERPPELLISGFAQSDSAFVSFGSDGRWQTVEPAAGAKPVSLRSVRLSSEALQLEVLEIESPPALQARQLLIRIGVFLLLLLGTAAALALLCLMVFVLNQRWSLSDLWSFAVPPFWVAMTGACMLALRFDTRIDDQLPFRPEVISLLLVAVIAWELLILFTRNKQRSAA